MMASQQGIDTHLRPRNQRVADLIKAVLRFTALGLLISLAYVAWVGLSVFSTFGLA